MEAEEHSWRFGSFSSPRTSAQQPSAASPIAQIHHGRPESDFVSDGDTTTLPHLQRPRLGYDVPYAPFWDHIVHPHAHNRSLSSIAAVGGPVGQYVHSGLDTARHVPVDWPTGFQGGFDAPTYPFNPANAFLTLPPSAMPYTIPGVFGGGLSSTGSYGRSDCDGGSNGSGSYVGYRPFVHALVPHSDPLAYEQSAQQVEQLATHSGQYAGGMDLGYVPVNYSADLHLQVQAQARQQLPIPIPIPAPAPSFIPMGPPLPHVGSIPSHYAASSMAYNPPLELEHQHVAGSSNAAAPAPPSLFDGRASITSSSDDAYIPHPDNTIRQILGLNAGQELSLLALADPPHGQRPVYPIPVLVALAILGSPGRQLTLQGIYLALEDRFEWYRNNRSDKSWQKSIRHYLSQYKCFRRVYKPMMVPGKGSLWVVDFSEEWGTKCQQRRRKTAGKNRGDGDARTK